MDIIALAGFITAFTVIFSACWKLMSFSHVILSKMEDYEEQMRIMNIHILKLALLDDNLPISDRIKAGEEYLSAGGNGYGKIIYNKLLDEMKKHDTFM